MKDRIKSFQRVPAALLKANPRNWRIHPAHQRHALAEVLEKIGFAGAVLARESPEGLVVIDGHLRLEEVGNADVPVLVTDLTAEEADQLLVVYDPLTLMAGRDDPMLTDLLKDLETWQSQGLIEGLDHLPSILDALGYEAPEAETDVHEVPTPQAASNPRCQPGDLWAIGDHRLLVADCTDPANADRLLAGAQPQCLFTSPPYAVGVDYGETYEDTLDNLRAMLPKLAALWKQHLVPGGYAVLNFNDIVAAKAITGSEEPCEYPMALEYYPVFREAGWVLWSRRIWCKPSGAVHSPWCMNGNRAGADIEHLWTFKTPGKTLIDHQLSGEYASQRGWIDTDHEGSVEYDKGTHGAAMPVKIAAYCVATHSKPGGLVWEPFGGTATTGVAAHLLGRVCYMSEVNSDFADLALERMETLLGEEARKL